MSLMSLLASDLFEAASKVTGNVMTRAIKVWWCRISKVLECRNRVSVGFWCIIGLLLRVFSLATACRSDDSYSTLFMLLCVGGIIYLVYSQCLAPTATPPTGSHAQPPAQSPPPRRNRFVFVDILSGYYVWDILSGYYVDGCKTLLYFINLLPTWIKN